MNSNKLIVSVAWLIVFLDLIGVLLMLYCGIKPKLMIIALIISILGATIIMIINKE